MDGTSNDQVRQENTMGNSCFHQIFKGFVYGKVTVFELPLTSREELGPLSRTEKDVVFSVIRGGISAVPRWSGLLRQRVPYYGGCQAKSDILARVLVRRKLASEGQSESHPELAPLQPLQDAIEIVGKETEQNYSNMYIQLPRHILYNL